MHARAAIHGATWKFITFAVDATRYKHPPTSDVVNVITCEMNGSLYDGDMECSEGHSTTFKA